MQKAGDSEHKHHNRLALTKKQGKENLNQREQMKEDGEGEEDYEEEEQPQHKKLHQPTRKITQIIGGQKKNYYHLKTVKSMEELEKFRFKIHCVYTSTKPSHIKKSITLYCTRRRFGYGCDFELKALRPNLDSEDIDVYAHSHHNHPLKTEQDLPNLISWDKGELTCCERRVRSRREWELMASENPPKIFGTADNMEWTFLQTFPDYGKMQEFQMKNQCKGQYRAEKWCRIRYSCRRKHKNNCQFILLAMKTAKQCYHVYKHGEHNHPAVKPWSSRRCKLFKSQQNEKQQEHMEVEGEEDEEEEEDGKEEDEGEDEEDDEEEEGKDEGQDGEEEEGEEEEAEDDEEEEGEEEGQDEDEEGNEDNDEDEVKQQPSRKITRIVRGKKRKYSHVKTVQSFEELDIFRFKNVCHINGLLPRRKSTFKSHVFPCNRKRDGKTCNFELRAERPDLKSGTIHVYAHFRHNHSIESEEKRWRHVKTKELMPDANPAKSFCTAENIEWTFLQTFPDYGKLQNLRLKNKCLRKHGLDVKWRRIRYCCHRKNSHKCEFILLAMKTAKQCYHVYKHGEHNHPVETSRKRQQPARGHQKQQAMEDDEEEEGEEEEEEGKDEDEGEKNEEAIEKDDYDEEESGGEVGDDIHGDELIEEEEDDDIIVIEDEVEQREEDKEEGGESMVIETIENENPLANAKREERLEVKLEEANGKVYKWMAGIGPNEIDGTIGDWDKLSLLKMVEMADQEIREHPQKLNLWLPWMKCAIPKCLPQIEGFNVRFKDLIKLTIN